MKVITRIWTAVFCLLIAGNSKINAQQNFISIDDGKMTRVTNLAITDSIGPNKQLVHTASFSIPISKDDGFKEVLTKLMKVTDVNSGIDINISRVNSDNKLIEERGYFMATIEELSVSPIDATSKSVLTVNVKIRSTAIKVTMGKNTIIPVPAPSIVKMALSSNYEFNMGALPGRRISKISKLPLGLNTGSQNFVIELSAIDSKDWYDWLLKNTKGSAAVEQGVVSLLAPDMKQVLFQLNLEDVSIVSYSFEANENAAPGTTVPPGKVRIGLSAKSVSFDINPTRVAINTQPTTPVVNTQPTTPVVNTQPTTPVVNTQPPAPVEIANLQFKTVRFENVEAIRNTLHIEQGPLTATTIDIGAWSAQWIVKPVPGTNYFWLVNKWKPAQRINVEKGFGEASTIDDGAWSAHWEFKKMPDNSYRIENRWKTGQYFYVENGKLQFGTTQSGTNSASWIIKIMN